MPIYHVDLDDGRSLRIEADDQDAALSGAQHFLNTTPLAPKFRVSPDDLKSARDAGYNDDEIADFLSAKRPEQFKAAKDAGYSSKEILSHLSGADQAPSGIIAGLAKGVADTVHGAGETAKQFLGADNTSTEKAAQTLTPKDYHGAPVIPEDGHWYDPTSYNWRNVPQAVAEAAPGMAADVLAAKAAGRINPMLGLAAGIGSYLLRTRGDAAKQDAAIRTGDANAAPVFQDKARALATGAVEAIPQAIGLSRFLPGANKIASVGTRGVIDSGKKLLTTGAVEGATGAAQNAVSQAGSTIGTDQGLSIDPNQVAAAGITSAATGGALASRGAVKDAANAIRFRDFGGENAIPTAVIANRVLTKVASPDGLQSPKAAYDATVSTKADVLNELRLARKAAAKSVAISPEADNALSRATKGRALDDGDMQAITDATSGMPGGDNLLALAKQANVLTKLTDVGSFDNTNKRFSGGAGERVRRFVLAHPLVSAAIGGEAASHGLGGISSLVSDPVAMAKTAAIGAGAYAALRAGDRFMGLSSPVRSFAEKFADTAVPIREQGNTQAPSAIPSASPSVSVPQVPAPQPSVLPHVIRKLAGQSDTGKANTGSTLNVEEAPIPQGLLFTKISPADHRIAEQATADFKQSGNVPDVVARRYHNSTAMRQARIRDRLQAISGDPRFPSEDMELMGALDKLRNVRSREDVAREIAAIAADHKDPEIRALLMAYFGPKWAASVWNPTRS